MIVCRVRMETRMIPNYVFSIDKRDFVPYTQVNGTVPERDAALPLPHGAGTVAAHGNPSRLPTEAAFICRRDCGGGIHSVVSQGAKERTCPHARGEVAKEELLCSRRRIFGSGLRSAR